MSGIAGIARSDGKSVDREILLCMAHCLSLRGPNAQQIWIDDAVGLVHAAHLIRGDETRSTQPESLGTGTWVTADVRLDARHELVAKLRSHERDVSSACSDSQLLLHAYDVWSEGCLRHLMGDFAFGLWDERKQLVFCACDHFGIRQLYFSSNDSGFVFSNTLDCVRLHPDVSDRLNDAAICDFLLFGMNQDERTTSFADIAHLPRGHWLRWSKNGLRIMEYWRPPIGGAIRYKKNSEYVAHFSELFEKAVADRVRGDSAGILLSGGVDSSSVAAVCREVIGDGHTREVHAFTMADESSEDPDGSAARLIADTLRIPLHCLCLNKAAVFDGWSVDGARWPEPMDDPLALGMLMEFRAISGHVPLVLSGEGADNLMNCEPGRHLRGLWRKEKYTQAALGVAEHAIARFQAPDGLRGPLRRAFNAMSPKRVNRSFPNWLNPKIVDALCLKVRWINSVVGIPEEEHPQHPGGYASLFLPQWRYLFERQDAAYTRAPVDVRYPFLDVRLVNYLLAIPPLPWFFRKFLLREAMRGRLPNKVRKRPKVSPGHDPLVQALSGPNGFDFSKETMNKGLERYIKRELVETPIGARTSEMAETKIRPWCLSLWMDAMHTIKSRPTAYVLEPKQIDQAQSGEFFSINPCFI